MRPILGCLLAFIALNAFGGGLYGMAGAKGVPVEWLRGSPFRDYFIPGLCLFAAVGGVWLAAALLVFRRQRRDRMAAALAGCLGLAWIAIQVYLIGFVSWLQPAVAAASLAVLAMAARLNARS